VTWIEQAQRNRDGRLWLELSELDIADWATVVSIDECPAQIEGEGRLVTGRFEHSSAEVLNLYVEGERTPIGTTASHPFWSQDRQAFVSAELLRTTERLRLEDGRTAAVTRIEQLPGTHSVYNLEVDGEHVYHVGLNGVLVHNTCAPKGTTKFYRAVSQAELDDVVKNGFRPGVGQMETKLLAESAEDGAYFARDILYKLDGKPTTLIEVELPNGLAKQLFKGTADGKTIFGAGGDLLDELNSKAVINVLDSMPIPK